MSGKPAGWQSLLAWPLAAELTEALLRPEFEISQKCPHMPFRDTVVRGSFIGILQDLKCTKHETQISSLERPHLWDSLVLTSGESACG